MDQPDDSVWPYIHCGICHSLFQRPRDPAGPPAVPFWLTECGHVVCNNHLRTDKACAQCGARDIQVVSLQRELDQPMADWFRPLPYALDAIAHAAKFQMHMVTTLLEAYKNKCLKQRQLIDSLRAEMDGYKRELEAREAPNSNGKRARVDYAASGGPSSHGLRTPTMQYQQPRAPAQTYYEPPPPQPPPPMQPPPRPESRFDVFAFAPPPEQRGPPARTAPMRVAQQGPSAWSSTPQPHHQQPPPSRQQMPPPAAPRFKPAPPPAPTPGARAAFYGTATPSANRSASAAPGIHGTGGRRFAPGNSSFRPAG